MFGMKNAPTEYQKLTSQMFAGIEGVINLLDDFIVFGKTRESHDETLKKVLLVLNEQNFCLNEEKCVYRVTELVFLGWHISEKGISPTTDKVESIKNFREPTSSDEVRSFLGLVNFVGHCIPDLATKTFHLRKLLKKEEKFTWGIDQQKAFDLLKNILSDGSVLGYFNPEDEIVLIVDASPVGLGAVLVQLSKKEERVISFASKSLSEVEQRYYQTEREALGIVFGIERFKYYLFGRDFWLYTDCKPLEFLFSERSKPCARIERWILRVQSFRFKVCYKPGKLNIADSLSRLVRLHKEGAIDSSCEYGLWQLVEHSRPVAISIQELCEASQSDSELLRVKEAMEEDGWTETVINYKTCREELCWVNGILLRGQRLVIPISLRPRSLQLAHEGHQGVVAMKGRLRTKVWWPNIDKDVEKFVKDCKECILVSLPNNPEPLKYTIFPADAWQAIALDFKGPLPSGVYLLVIIDYYSKFTVVEYMTSITAEKLTQCLRKVFANFGPPMSIRADNGPQINCEEFKRFCREFNIRLVFSTPYWPQANGEVERMNRTIEKRLQISQVNSSDWKEDLQMYLINYHATPHATTGKSPGELMMKRKLRDKIPQIEEMQGPRDEEVSDRVAIKKDKMKEFVDGKRNAKESDITIGDEVVLWNMRKKNKLDTNFSPEEYIVVEKKGGEITAKSKIDGSIKKRNITHVKKVRSKGDDEKQAPEGSQGDAEQEGHEGIPEQQTETTTTNMETQAKEKEVERADARPKRSVRMPSRFNN